MAQKLTDILKGARQGLFDLTFGMSKPLDTSRYDNLRTEEERIGYSATMAGVTALALVGIATIMSYIHSQE